MNPLDFLLLCYIRQLLAQQIRQITLEMQDNVMDENLDVVSPRKCERFLYFLHKNIIILIPKYC